MMRKSLLEQIKDITDELLTYQNRRVAMCADVTSAARRFFAGAADIWQGYPLDYTARFACAQLEQDLKDGVCAFDELGDLVCTAVAGDYHSDLNEGNSYFYDCLFSGMNYGEMSELCGLDEFDIDRERALFRADLDIVLDPKTMARNIKSTILEMCGVVISETECAPNDILLYLNTRCNMDAFVLAHYEPDYPCTALEAFESCSDISFEQFLLTHH